MKTRKTSVNHGNSSSSSSCLLAKIRSLIPFTFYCVLLNGFVMRAFYYTKEDLSFLWDSKMPNAGPTEASNKGEQAEYSSLSVSNWVCRRSSASSEPVLKKKALLWQTNTFCAVLNYFPMGSLFSRSYLFSYCTKTQITSGI